jgi:hypothetical protein
MAIRFPAAPTVTLPAIAAAAQKIPVSLFRIFISYVSRHRPLPRVQAGAAALFVQTSTAS